ncbi:hypothetical protein AC579_964 [Pseudocercospora musae]|uniref:Uncharacterized protein n=1 Tax=Pseudocercospora musae TaxID=113226 RepID=A0A139IUR3_9PEZI|nr:hypothetical protein AC579_964 [Pseudocercospora musae]
MSYISILNPRSRSLWPNAYQRPRHLTELMANMNADAAVPSAEQPDPSRKAVGSTWLARYNQQSWPVVLCGENEPPEAFTKTCPKNSSSRPAILLGKHKYIWVHVNQLDEYVPSHDYLNGTTKFSPEDLQPDDDDLTKIEKFRQIAFRRDAPEMKDNAYWNNFILQQSAARRIEKQMAAGKKRKRAKTSTLDEDGNNSVFPFRTGYNKPQSSYSVIDLDESSSDKSNGYITPASPVPRHNSMQAKGSKKDETIEIDDRTDSESEVSSDESVSREDSCHVIVGQTKKPFVVHQKHLRGCDYLLALLEKNSHSGGYLIDLSNDQRAIERKVSTKDFERIVHFMKTRDIGSSLQRILEESYDLRSHVYGGLIENSMAGKRGFD